MFVYELYFSNNVYELGESNAIRESYYMFSDGDITIYTKTRYKLVDILYGL